MSTTIIDKEKVLYNLIQFRSKYLLMDMNEAIKEIKNNITELQTNLTSNKSKLCKLILEINKYYKIDDKKNSNEPIKNQEIKDKIENKNIDKIEDIEQQNLNDKQNNIYPTKYDTEQLNEVLKYYTKPTIIINKDQEEIKQNLTDIRDNIIELNKNLTHKDDNLDLSKAVNEQNNTVSMDLNFTDTK